MHGWEGQLLSKIAHNSASDMNYRYSKKMESTVGLRLKEKVMLEMGHDIQEGKKKEER